MRKFFFDDVRTPPGPEWILARDVPAAQHILSNHIFDVMSLDHDIGFQMMCDECYDEIPKPITTEMLNLALINKLRLGCEHMLHGTDLAKWMVEHIQVWPELILIHSANPYGAQRMSHLLARYTEVKVIPFHALNYSTLAWKVREDKVDH